MASPQREAGFAPVANEILEAIAGVDLTALELRTVAFVLRRTYGAVGNPKTAALSVSDVAMATRTTRARAAAILRGLILKRVLVEGRPPEGRTARLLGLQKDHDLWPAKSQSS